MSREPFPRFDQSAYSFDAAAALHFASFPIAVSSSANDDFALIYVNPAFERLTGYSATEILGRNCRFLQGPDTDSMALTRIREGLHEGRDVREELLNYRKNGDKFWNELTIVPRRDNTGKLIGFTGIQNDVTSRRAAQQAKSQSEDLLKSIVEHIPGFVYRRVRKADGTIELRYLSPSLTEFFGLQNDKVFDFAVLSRNVHPDDLNRLEAAIAGSAATLSQVSVEFRILGANGGERWVRSYSTPRRSGDEIIWDVIAIDISQEKALESTVSYLSYSDPLTGLPSRASFEQSLTKAISNLTETSSLVVWVIELSGLREINDVAGRGVGDEVLGNAADRLATLCVERGGRLVARTGGSEFSILSMLSDPDAEAEEFAHAILDVFSAAVPDGEKEFALESAVGFTILRGSRISQADMSAALSAEVLRQANIALFAAKRAGSNKVFKYEEALDDKVRDRLARRQSIQRALAERQFSLHYHPLVDLASGTIVGAEALVRWQHPDLGMQRPDLFIPLAEETGLIVPLGEWIVREAMRQVAEWKEEGLKPPRVAINVSSVQIKNSDFPATLARALKDFSADPSDFELELTEGQLFEQSAATLATLQQIKAMGFDLAVDDFGTGYSSLQYVRELPVDKIKIDQTFIRKMVIDSSDAVIVRTIVAMGRSLNLDVVAEGIETEMQREFLEKEGCRIGQGYLFSLPLVPEDFAWLAKHGVKLPRRTD